MKILRGTLDIWMTGQLCVDGLPLCSSHLFGVSDAIDVHMSGNDTGPCYNRPC